MTPRHPHPSTTTDVLPATWQGCFEPAPRRAVALSRHRAPDSAEFGRWKAENPFLGEIVKALRTFGGAGDIHLNCDTLAARRAAPVAPARVQTVSAADRDGSRQASRYPEAPALRRALGEGNRQLVSSRRVPTASGVATVALPVRLGRQADVAVGRALDYRQAERTAIFEALERHCSMHRHQAIVRASYAQLARAADPTQFLLPTRADLAQLGAGWHPYRPELRLDWTPAYSCAKRREVWIPARLAFFGYDADPRYVSESTSGSALGSSREEAMLHALMEVIERDAFLMTWYCRRPATRLRLPHDPTTQLLMDAARRQGYALHALDTTLETGLPSVWVLARREQDGGAATLSSAGAHLQPLRALHGAMLEVVASISLLGQQWDVARSDQLARHPEKVHTPLDHFLLFADPAYAHALDFLQRGPQADLTEAFAPHVALWQGSNPAEHLKRLLTRLIDVHGDVYFVDQTVKEVRQLGLHCVRAIVPGSLPMTFGHWQRRGTFSPRRQSLCHALHPSLTSSDVAAWFTPHPFG